MHYILAHATLSLLIAHTTAFYLPVLPSLIPGHPDLILMLLPIFNTGECAIVGKWKNYSKWEERNPLEMRKGRNRSSSRGSKVSDSHAVLPKNLASCSSLSFSLSDYVNHRFMAYHG